MYLACIGVWDAYLSTRASPETARRMPSALSIHHQYAISDSRILVLLLIISAAHLTFTAQVTTHY